MRHSIPYIIIIVLLVLLFFSLTNKKVEVVEKHTTDTITITRIDTFKASTDTFLSEMIVDTIYIEKSSEKGLELIRTQKYYRGDNYSAWVSGYNPSLDSIETYNRIVNNTITNEIVKEVYPKRTDLYLNFGSLYINNQFAPNIGGSIKFRNNLVIGANVGIYDKKPYYGLNFGFKLNNKR